MRHKKDYEIHGLWQLYKKKWTLRHNKLWDKGSKELMEKSKEQIVDGMEKQGKRYVSVDG